MGNPGGQGVRDRFGDDQALHDVIALLFNMYNLMCPALLEHSRELAYSCEALARALGWSKEDTRTVFLAALFHDVGHLMAPGDICNWRGDGPPPRENMETEHPEYGERLLRQVNCLEPILPVIRHHHEHYDGSGFPDGLRGEGIPLMARLVAVPHKYQILIKGYGSSPPLPYAEAVAVMEEDAGVILDPDITTVFLEKIAG